MAPHSGSSITPMDLLRICDGLVIQQALYAAVKLGVADLLQDGPRSTSEIAGQIEVHEPALYRLLRALATQGVFEETTGRTFANNQLSRFLCTGVPGSVRSMVGFAAASFSTSVLARSFIASRPGSRLDRSCLGNRGNTSGIIPSSLVSSMMR